MTSKAQPLSSWSLESPGKGRHMDKQLQYSVINAAWQMNVRVLWGHTGGPPNLGLGGVGKGMPHACAET